jgi:hypothetical protein
MGHVWNGSPSMESHCCRLMASHGWLEGLPKHGRRLDYGFDPNSQVVHSLALGDESTRTHEVSATLIVQDVLRATRRNFQLTATIKSRNVSIRISSPKSKHRIRNDLDLIRSCTHQRHKNLTSNPLLSPQKHPHPSKLVMHNQEKEQVQQYKLINALHATP